MQDFAEQFYKSKAWQKCRAEYIKQCGGLCELCKKNGEYVPGVIVHHKKHLTRFNISDPGVSLSFDNLQLLCRDCHGKAHRNETEKKYFFNENGELVLIPPYSGK